MKGNKKLLIVAALILLITVSFTTYAIYRESTTVDGTIRAAAWNVKIKEHGASGEGVALASANLVFDASDINWTVNPGRNGTIAPGATGTITYDIVADGSEVDVYVTAEIVDSSATLPQGFSAAVTGGTGKIEYSSTAGEMTRQLVITVIWEGDLSDTSAEDANHLSFQDEEIEIPVLVTARQGVASEEA